MMHAGNRSHVILQGARGMDFHSFMSRELGMAQDGVHKECRAKDPDNCRKCHTGRYSTRGVREKSGGSARRVNAAKEPWKVFKKGGRELFAYTVRGEGAEEEAATKRTLADENGCRPEDIDVVQEDRVSINGPVPGQKPLDDASDVKRIEAILAELWDREPYYEIEDMEVIARGDGVFEIKGGMINAKDGDDVENALWGVRGELLRHGYRDADWNVSGECGFFLRCRKET